MQGWTTPDRTIQHANTGSSRPRWRGQVYALAAVALGACLLLATVSTAAVATEFRNIIANHTPYDFDRDGTPEIEHLEMLFEDEATESTPSVANLVVVLVQDRLLTTLPGAEYSVGDLLARLQQLRQDLRAQGYTPRLVITRLYDGAVHQDGKTVLALRELFRATRASYPDLTGTLLVGNFPDAMIVRSILWRKSDDRLTIKPEVVARRSDLVLADLDGAWAQIYRQGKQNLVSWNAVSLTPLPTNPAEWPCNGCAIQSKDFLSGLIPFEDFFYIQDGTYSTNVSGQVPPILTVFMHNVAVGPEIAPHDRSLSNAIAQPEIVVSRIDPYRVAVQPDPAFRDLHGKGYLDAAGRPQAVRTRDPVRWVHAAALERQMLIEYFDRNHAYRAGNGNRPLRTAAITYPEKDFKVASFSSFLQQAADGFATPIVKGDASVLDFARWLEQPATLKGIHAHANRDITQFGGVYDVAQLEQEVGPDIWHWVRQGDRLVPGLGNLGQNVGDGLFYSMWRNLSLATTGGVFYLHNGCDVHSPIDAETRRFNDPLYGVRQNAEGFLFYLNGVAMIARSKDFNDRPEGFTAALREDSATPFGAGWLQQFEVAAADAGLARSDIQRKRSYNWGLLGDWTLALRPPRVDSSVIAFEGPSYTSYAMQLAPGTYDRGDFAWRPDDIDSFAVPSSLELRMFHSGNGVGRYVTVRHDLPDVNHYFYDHYINSVEVRSRGRDTATLYSEANYWGAQASIPPGHYTFTQIRDSFGLNPKSVSSIRLDGVEIFLYDRQTWWNEWRAFGSSVANLTPYGWNDRLESIVVVPKGQYTTAYQYQSWAGKHVVLEPGRYDTPDLQALGLSGWAISSISMGSGIRIRAYRQPGFQGTSLVLNAQSVSDLIPLGWNDSIVSMIVERR